MDALRRWSARNADDEIPAPSLASQGRSRANQKRHFARGFSGGNVPPARAGKGAGDRKSARFPAQNRIVAAFCAEWARRRAFRARGRLKCPDLRKWSRHASPGVENLGEVALAAPFAAGPAPAASAERHGLSPPTAPGRSSATRRPAPVRAMRDDAERGGRGPSRDGLWQVLRTARQQGRDPARAGAARRAAAQRPGPTSTARHRRAYFVRCFQDGCHAEVILKSLLPRHAGRTARPPPSSCSRRRRKASASCRPEGFCRRLRRAALTIRGQRIASETGMLLPCRCRSRRDGVAGAEHYAGGKADQRADEYPV